MYPLNLIAYALCSHACLLRTDLIAFKLGRKLKYKGHYMYDYVRPEKLIAALKWLKANNPLYAHVNVNEHWVNQAEANDAAKV